MFIDDFFRWLEISIPLNYEIMIWYELISFRSLEICRKKFIMMIFDIKKSISSICSIFFTSRNHDHYIRRITKNIGRS